MSAPGSRACPIRATSGAKETDHLRIAAASRASANCWKPSPTQTTQIMPTRRNGPTTTIPTRSTNCQSNMPSPASQTAATPLAHGSPRKSPSVRPPDPRGLHRMVTPHRTDTDLLRENLELTRGLVSEHQKLIQELWQLRVRAFNDPRTLFAAALLGGAKPPPVP